MIFLKATKPCSTRSGRNTVAGVDAAGEPRVFGNPVSRSTGEFFTAKAGESSELVARRVAEAVKPAGTFGLVLNAVLSAKSNKAAAVAGRSIPGVTVWHGEVIDGEMRPARGSFGPTRHSASFGSGDEIEEFWDANPAAVPVFTVPFEGGAFRKCFRWRAGGLLEIAA